MAGLSFPFAQCYLCSGVLCRLQAMALEVFSPHHYLENILKQDSTVIIWDRVVADIAIWSSSPTEAIGIVLNQHWAGRIASTNLDGR